MKQQIVKLTFVFILLLTISSTIKAQGNLDGNWRLICYTDLELETEECRSVDHNPSITLRFSDNGKVGSFEGYTTSNKVCGKYELFDNNIIKVIEFGGTKRGEIDKWGNYFWNTIRQSTSYKLLSDNLRLVIYYDNDTKGMVFLKVE